MPKMKTSRGAAKRFRVTKRGKIKAKKSNMRHILTTKNKNRKRHLRKAKLIGKANIKQIRRLLPNG